MTAIVFVVMRTRFGDTHMIDMLVGDPLPRMAFRPSLARR
jgi:hypothetical protein